MTQPRPHPIRDYWIHEDRAVRPGRFWLWGRPLWISGWPERHSAAGIACWATEGGRRPRCFWHPDRVHKHRSRLVLDGAQHRALVGSARLKRSHRLIDGLAPIATRRGMETTREDRPRVSIENDGFPSAPKPSRARAHLRGARSDLWTEITSFAGAPFSSRPGRRGCRVRRGDPRGRRRRRRTSTPAYDATRPPAWQDPARPESVAGYAEQRERFRAVPRLAAISLWNQYKVVSAHNLRFGWPRQGYLAPAFRSDRRGR
jgi:hypothetical protein